MSETLTVPQSGQIKDYNLEMQKVPDVDQPSLFGLPANIDRSVQRFNSTFVINQLKQLAAVSDEDLRFDK